MVQVALRDRTQLGCSSVKTDKNTNGKDGSLVLATSTNDFVLLLESKYVILHQLTSREDAWLI